MFALRFAEPLASIKKNKKNVYLYMKKILAFCRKYKFLWLHLYMYKKNKKNRDVHKYKKGLYRFLILVKFD